MTTQKPDTQESWLKANLFSVINLVILAVGLAFSYGVSSAKMEALEVKAEVQQKLIADMVQNGHPAHEARITSLEKKTDDLSVLKQIVNQQSENIKNLTDTVRQDHDILLRLVSQKN